MDDCGCKNFALNRCTSLCVKLLNMPSASTLPSAAFQAAKSALATALAENQVKVTPTNGDGPLEEGEIQTEVGETQVVDMQQQAENISTVFNDPKNFNVKVRQTR